MDANSPLIKIFPAFPLCTSLVLDMNPVNNHLQTDAKAHFLKCSTIPFHGTRQRLLTGNCISHCGHNSGYSGVQGSIVSRGSTSRAQSSVGTRGRGGGSSARGVALVEAVAPVTAAPGVLVLGAVALGAVARGAAARGTAVFGVAEFIVYPYLSRVVGRRRARAYGCHFCKFPQSQHQALLALWMIIGIQLLENNNLDADKKEQKHSS